MAKQRIIYVSNKEELDNKVIEYKNLGFKEKRDKDPSEAKVRKVYKQKLNSIIVAMYIILGVFPVFIYLIYIRRRETRDVYIKIGEEPSDETMISTT